MKKDFFGEELNIGDTVAFVAPGYRHLAKGTITRFAEKTVFISYQNTWNFVGKGSPSDIKQLPDQIVKWKNVE